MFSEKSRVSLCKEMGFQPIYEMSTKPRRMKINVLEASFKQRSRDLEQALAVSGDLVRKTGIS